ncbi:MAG: histidinol dehydrogenase, partial [Woeseiaceae bacterium]
MTPEITNWASLDDAAREALLLRPAIGSDTAIREQVARIIADVKTAGDAAVASLTARLDKVQIADARVTAEEIAAATSELSASALAAIDLAIDNVRKFHELQLPQALRIETMPGVVCEKRSHAIDAVGLYVPAGTAPLPSAAVMLAVPAAIAGCPVRIM